MSAATQPDGRQRGLRLVQPVEPVITAPVFDHIPAGQYAGFSRAGTVTFDDHFRRWTCVVWWNVFSGPSSIEVIARVPWWLNLGSGQKPRAGRRTKFYQAWVRAHGGQAISRRDRPSPQIFLRRMALIAVRDTAGVDPYSVVDRVIEWMTGEGPSIQPSTHPRSPASKRPPEREL